MNCTEPPAAMRLVLQELERAGALVGHIHQPQHLSAEVKGRRCDLYVMGDWCGGTQDYVEHDGRDFRLRPWA